MNYNDLKVLMLSHGYKWFYEPCMLNIIVIRSTYNSDNHFNDVCYIAYISEAGLETVFEINVTSLPGWFYMKSPMNTKGCAIIVPNQYIDCWKAGAHFNQYALVQCAPISVYRDNNHDNIIDISGWSIDTGIFAVNFHHADEISEIIGKWSAGCIVAKKKADHTFLMYLVDRQIAFAKHDRFSITILLKE